MQYVCIEFLKKRSNVVLLAQANPMIVCYLGAQYDTDKELWLAAAQQNWEVMNHAPKEMCGLSEFMLLALPRHSHLIQNGNQALLNDPAFCLAVVKLDGDAIRYFDHRLRADRRLALEAIRQCPAALQHVSEELRINIEFCHEAVRENKAAIKHIPDEVWKVAWESLGI